MRSILLSTLLAALAMASCAPHSNGASPGISDPKPASVAPARPPRPGGPCTDLNTATAEELSRLPGIGEATARKIIEHRERNGPFRRTEHVIIINGLSEKKYLAIARLICAG